MINKRRIHNNLTWYVDDYKVFLFINVLCFFKYPGISEKRRMPPNTSPVPIQCRPVKGFWKYQMEKRTLMNFLMVRTREAVRLVHSVVRTNTEKMQMYWRQTLAAR